MHQFTIKSAAVILCVTVCFLSGIQSQQPPAANSDLTSRGVALYEQGNLESATKALREAIKSRKEDSKAWHYLGLVLIKQGIMKEAGEALSKAVDLRYSSFSREFYSQGEELRDDRLLLLKTLLTDEIESQKKLLEILAEKQLLEKEQLALERSQIQEACMEQNTRVVDGHRVLKKSDMKIQKLRVLFRPEPIFPDSARQANKSGAVILKAVVLPDGSVRYIKPIQSSGDAFTEEATRAALKTRFQPASICRKLVAFPVQLEYSFGIGW